MLMCPRHIVIISSEETDVYICNAYQCGSTFPPPLLNLYRVLETSQDVKHAEREGEQGNQPRREDDSVLQ